MKDIKLQDCIEFQDCFLFDGRFSPFEDVDDFLDYYPRVLLGEIGGLINLSCKLVRTSRTYDEEIEDECVDIFIYLLLFGRMLEIHRQKEVFNSIRTAWDEPFPALRSKQKYNDCCASLMEMALRLIKPGKEQYYNDAAFHECFLVIRQASCFITNQSWQQLVNQFHRQTVIRHTDPTKLAFNGLFNGVFQIRMSSLLKFIEKVEIDLPQKRVKCLKELEAAQVASSVHLHRGIISGVHW